MRNRKNRYHYHQPKPYISRTARKQRKRKIFWGVAVTIFFLASIFSLLLFRLYLQKGKVSQPDSEAIALADSIQGKYDLDRILSDQNYELLYRYSEQQLSKNRQDFYWLHLYGLAAYHLATSLLMGEHTDLDQGNQYLDTAIKALSQSSVLTDKENRFLIETLLGKAYYAKGRFYMDCAVYHFQKALDLVKTGKAKLKENQMAKNITNLHYYLGSAYSEMGDFDKSIHYFTLLDGEEKNLLYIAVSYYKQSNYLKAYEYLEQIINSTRDKNLKISCLNWKAKIYFEEGKYESALTIYDSLIKDYPYSPDPLYRMGLVFYEMNNKVKARSYFRKAAEKEIPCPQANEALLTLF